MRRAIATLALAACLVLAGCSGGGSGTATSPATADTPAVTEAETTEARGEPTTPTATPTAGADLTLEPGARVAPSALAAAHAAVLDGRSFSYVERGPAGEFTTTVGERGLVAETRPRLDTQYGTADTVYRRDRDDGGSIRHVARPRTRSAKNGTAVLARLGTDLVVAETVDRDGERRYVLETGVDPAEVPDRTEYARLVVDERGLVRNFSAGVVRDGTVAFEESFEVTDLGSASVDAPDWVGLVADGSVDAAAGVGTAVVVHEETGARLTVTAPVDTLDSVSLQRSQEPVFTDPETPLGRAAVTPYLTTDVSGPYRNATVRLPYDESAIPDGAAEGNLSLYVYNETVGTYLPLNTSVDTDADVLVATEAPEVRYSTGGGPERTVTPRVVARDSLSIVVGAHVPTYIEALRERAPQG
jgi:hypothetical protein